MKKTVKNPYGLTGKQKLVIEDMVEKIKRGKSITPKESVKKVYDINTPGSLKARTSQLMNNEDFRAGFLQRCHTDKILGANSTVSDRLIEGLDASDKEGHTDFTNRLKYIQEINKIAGVYAPTKTESKSMNLSMDISEEALDAKIEELKKELKP